jgi:hypothetical protein
MNEFTNPNPDDDPWHFPEGSGEPIKPFEPADMSEIQEPSPQPEGPFLVNSNAFGKGEYTQDAEMSTPPTVDLGSRLDVEQFDTAQVRPEDQEAMRMAMCNTASKTIETYEDYIQWGDDTHEYAQVGLEYRQNGEYAQITVGSSHRGSTIMVSFAHDYGDLSPIDHTYFFDPSQDVCRRTRDAGVVYSDLPREGTMSEKERIEATKRIDRQESPNQRLANELGIGYKAVGDAEAQYVRELVRRAEPAICTVDDLERVAREREKSDHLLGDDEAQKAGIDFEKMTSKFLSSREAEGVLKAEMVSPAGDLTTTRITVEGNSADYAATPCVKLETSKVIQNSLGLKAVKAWLQRQGKEPQGLFNSSLTYRVQDGRLVVERGRWVTDNNGSKMGEHLGAAVNADELEVRLVRNFLRKPCLDEYMEYMDDPQAVEWHRPKSL